MKAVRLHGPLDLRVEELDPPGPPVAGWATIRVQAAGICGSDLHNYRTGQWLTDRPTVAGHELTGVISALGTPGGTLAVGDRVVADSRFWCGTCARCRSGRRHLCETLGFVGEVCDGGLAVYTTLPVHLLHRIGRGPRDQVAVLTEPLAVALHACARLSAPPAAPVLVVGSGTIGGLVALVLSRLEDRPVWVADKDGARAALVAELTGAVPVSLGRALPTIAQDRPLLHIVDATGNIKALEQILAIAEPGSTIALVGITHGTIALDPNLLVERELALVGCHAFADEMARAIELLDRLGGDLARFVGQTIALDDVPAAYAAHLAGTAPGLKTVVACASPTNAAARTGSRVG